jgi:tetratricopeptide (TPR) repeat protein
MTKGVSRHTLAPMHQMVGDHYLIGRMNEAIDASDDIALHGMGLLDLRERQANSALDALEKAITLDLNNSEYHVTLGIAHSMNNNLNLAKLSFQEAVRLKPNNLSVTKFCTVPFKSRRIKKCCNRVPPNLKKTGRK